MTALAFITEIHPAGDSAVVGEILAGRWYVPLDVAACGTVADIAAEDTDDGRARRFVCDKRADHLAAGDLRHRHVTDIETGRSIEWTADDAENGASA